MIANQHERVYERLTFLRSLRNTADYELQVSLATLIANADDAELYAEEIIARLDELTAGHVDKESADTGISEAGTIIPAPE